MNAINVDSLYTTRATLAALISLIDDSRRSFKLSHAFFYQQNILCIYIQPYMAAAYSTAAYRLRC